MPADRSKYPPDWKHVSRAVRDRSGGQCECEGHCGLHRTNPGPRRCVERNGEKATWARGKVVLTVAHLNADDVRALRQTFAETVWPGTTHTTASILLKRADHRVSRR